MKDYLLQFMFLLSVVILVIINKLESIRNYAVLNIVSSEAKVFSTKERSPYYICLEIYRPEEEIMVQKVRMYIYLFRNIREENQHNTSMKMIFKNKKLMPKNYSRI